MLSRYRDPEEMMLERGVEVDHTTIHGWVQAYAPELDKRKPIQSVAAIALKRTSSLAK
jgi:transposase-like protein